MTRSHNENVFFKIELLALMETFNELYNVVYKKLLKNEFVYISQKHLGVR